MFCSKCQTECPDDAVFCSKCAANLSIHGVERLSDPHGFEMKVDTLHQLDHDKEPALAQTLELTPEPEPEPKPGPEPEPEPGPGAKPEPGPRSKPKSGSEPKPEPKPDPTPTPRLTPDPSLAPERSPVKEYLLVKSVLYGIICLVSLLIVVGIAVPLIRPIKEIGLSSYAELDNLLGKGSVRVKVSKDSVESIILEQHINIDKPNTQLGSMRARKYCSIVELPDGIIILDGNHSNYPQTSDSFWLFTPRRDDGEYLDLIDESIKTLNLYNMYMEDPNRSEQIEVLQRIRYNTRPIVLTLENPDSFNWSLVIMVPFIILFFAFGISLYNSAMIFFSPEKSKTYRELGKFGDPARLLSECEKSFGSREQLALRKYICTPGFILYPRALSVTIAPVKELIWAYLSVYNNSDDHMQHQNQLKHWDNLEGCKLVLSFSTGTRIIARVRNKGIGISELHRLKKQNPNSLTGFRKNLQTMFESDFNGFIEKITTDIESMQQGVDAKDVFIDEL